MKFSMDESMKHRVIGITVIISIAAVFLPAMLKKNSQRMDSHEIAIHLPPKPEKIEADNVDEEQVFKSVKVAHVELPAVDTHRTDVEEKETSYNDSPEPLQTVENVSQEEETVLSLNSTEPSIPASSIPSSTGQDNSKSQLKTEDKPLRKTAQVKPHPHREKTNTASVSSVQAKSSSVKKAPKTATIPLYAVQMGVFSDKKNAQKFINILKNKGFSGNQSVVYKGTKKVYKVTVGNSADRVQAEKLKQLLLTQTRIKGFIVEKGVG